MRNLLASLCFLSFSFSSFADPANCPPWDISCKYSDSSVPVDNKSARALLSNLDKLRAYLAEPHVIVSKKLYALGLTDNTASATEGLEFCYAMAGNVDNNTQLQFEYYRYDKELFDRFSEANFADFNVLRKKVRNDISFIDSEIRRTANNGDIYMDAYATIKNITNNCKKWARDYKNYVSSMT